MLVDALGNPIQADQPVSADPRADAVAQFGEEACAYYDFLADDMKARFRNNTLNLKSATLGVLMHTGLVLDTLQSVLSADPKFNPITEKLVGLMAHTMSVTNYFAERTMAPNEAQQPTPTETPDGAGDDLRGTSDAPAAEHAERAELDGGL